MKFLKNKNKTETTKNIDHLQQQKLPRKIQKMHKCPLIHKEAYNKTWILFK